MAFEQDAGTGGVEEVRVDGPVGEAGRHPAGLAEGVEDRRRVDRREEENVGPAAAQRIHRVVHHVRASRVLRRFAGVQVRVAVADQVEW